MFNKTSLSVSVLLAASGLLVISAPVSASQTTLSSQVFANFSNIQIDDQHQDIEDWQLDVKRFYLNLDHQFNDDWSLTVTTDVQWQRQQDPTDIWFRHAYIKRNFNQGSTLKIGVAELPWIDYIARRVGYRYVDQSLTPKNKLAGPTDLGIHYGHKSAHFSYAVSAITGGGFQKPTVGDRIDLEASAVWHINKQFDFALGAYQGTRALDKDEAEKNHTAERFNAALSYLHQGVRFGVEYVYNDNWNQVNKIPQDASSGWGTWASYAFKPGYSAFARYDTINPNRRLNASLERDYIQLGVDYKATSYLTLALVAKQSNIDSATVERTQNEVGIWSMWNFK